MESGQNVAHYRVLDKIGSGGMGEVWAAEDTRLGRKVALKTFPPWAVEDGELRARFEREARAIAAINHPHIVTIHAVEEAEGTLFLAMELIEGEPLTRHLKHALPLDRFFEIAIPLTDAVAAAHAKGILHRDLKPDNVMLTTDDSVKVLDFGVAKLQEDNEGGPSELSRETTDEGRVVGTTAYMSPEQAEGITVGPQSDVFSLGILLYQMVTGQRPFKGNTTVSMLSSILKDEPPPVTALDERLPKHLGRIIRRCLQKDKDRRYTTAQELSTELLLLQEELEEGDPEARPARRHRVRTAILLTGAAGLLALAAWGWMRDAPGRGAARARFTEQTFFAGVETQPSLSPDGTMLAYRGQAPGGNADIFLQRVQGRNPINLTLDSPADESSPAFSPDGTQLAFRSEREGGGIFVMGATGESIRRITDFGYDPAWSPDGTQLVFATEEAGSPFARYETSELWIVNVGMGEPRSIFPGDAVQPAWSPNGERIAFWTTSIGGGGSGQRDVATIAPDGSGLVMVTDDLPVDWRPLWHPDGKSLFLASDRGGTMNIWSVPVDPVSGVVRGEMEPITVPSLWSGPFAVDGAATRIAYVAQDDRARLMRVGFDPESGQVVGTPEPVTEGALIVWMFDASPDGEWIAFDNQGTQEDLYLVRPDGSSVRKLTDDVHKDRGVSWWGNDRLVFYSSRSGRYEIWSVRPDGGELHAITQTTGPSFWLPDVSPDGSQLVVHNTAGSYLFDLTGDLPLTQAAEHIPGTEALGDVFAGLHWSPDGSRILGQVGVPHVVAVAVYDLRDGSFSSFVPPVDDDLRAIGWLPDGRSFLAAAGGWAWRFDVDTGEATKLPLRIGAETAKISPDGQVIYYVEVTTQADIWVAQFE